MLHKDLRHRCGRRRQGAIVKKHRTPSEAEGLRAHAQGQKVLKVYRATRTFFVNGGVVEMAADLRDTSQDACSTRAAGQSFCIRTTKQLVLDLPQYEFKFCQRSQFKNE